MKAYEKHTVAELRALAKAKGLRGYSAFKKQELVTLLKNTDAKGNASPKRKTPSPPKKPTMDSALFFDPDHQAKPSSEIGPILHYTIGMSYSLAPLTKRDPAGRKAVLMNNVDIMMNFLQTHKMPNLEKWTYMELRDWYGILLELAKYRPEATEMAKQMKEVFDKKPKNEPRYDSEYYHDFVREGRTLIRVELANFANSMHRQIFGMRTIMEKKLAPKEGYSLIIKNIPLYSAMEQYAEERWYTWKDMEENILRGPLSVKNFNALAKKYDAYCKAYNSSNK